jgi:hypothetical protein
MSWPFGWETEAIAYANGAISGLLLGMIFAIGMVIVGGVLRW